MLIDDFADRIASRNEVSSAFFSREAERLASVCKVMAQRFADGGRLISYGRGAYATDSQHVAVEFVHPVIVGKRALPALDLGLESPAWISAVVRPGDIVMGFGPPDGDPVVDELLADLTGSGILTLALPGRVGHYSTSPHVEDPFVHQELIEILYHTLWETVHVFFEHREMGHDVGAAAFLYPFLGQSKQETGSVEVSVAASIIEKAAEVERLREVAARELEPAMRDAAKSINARLTKGAQILCFGNGGSATDATDFAIDCAMPPESKGLSSVPAISLSRDAAILSAIANDIDAESIFLRQIVAQSKPGDVAVSFSTSGSSRNVLAALAEARRRNLLTVAFVGYDGGEIVNQGLADIALTVGSDYVPRIQEVHASLYHVLRETLEV